MDLGGDQLAMAPISFIHIHKTGGISITNSLARLFDDRWVHNHADFAFLDQPNSYGLIAAHEPFSSFEKLGIEQIYITCLRKPVPRLKSLYRFWKSVKYESIWDINSVVVTVKNLTFEEFLKSEDKDVKQYVDNETTRMLSSAHPNNSVCEEDFEIACQNLQKMSAIMLVEDLDNDLMNFYNRLDVSSRFSLQRLNVTDNNFISQPAIFGEIEPVRLDQLSAIAREAIATATYFDTRLYNYAVALRDQKKSQPIRGIDKIPFRRARLSRGETIVPTDSEAYAALRDSGWATHYDPQYSVRPSASLRFTIVGGATSGTSAKLKFSGLLLPNRHSMIVSVRADGGPWVGVLFSTLSQIDLSDPHLSQVKYICGTGASAELSFDLQAEPDEAFVHCIEFKHDGVSSPQTLGFNHDNRELGVRFESIEIK